jgi:transcriptional regulator with XRE-family HTH domain
LTNAIAQIVAINIRTAREAIGLSQEDLADAASLAQSDIYFAESGKRTPTFLSLTRIAGTLGVTIEDLLDGAKWHPTIAHERGYFALRDTRPELMS